MRIVLILLALLLSMSPASASVEVRQFDDPVLEQRYQKLIDELRCLVCQNQNLADSNAELAQDLRKEVFKMLQAGQSDKEIIDFMVARYGDFVLYRPPVKPTTFLLWLGPFILLAIAVLVLMRVVRQRAAVAPVHLTDEQRRQAEQLLSGKEEPTEKSS